MCTLNILYQSSSAYAIPAAVSMCSLLENNKDIDNIKFWFIDVGLTDEDKEGLLTLVERYGRSVEFLASKQTDKLLSDAGVELWSGSYATFYKIFTCCSLEGVDQLLYIDADTIVIGSLKPLVDYDFENFALAMVGSGMTDAVKDYLSIPNYFNAGIIFFNITYWREHNVVDKFVEAINHGNSEKLTMIGDETLINAVLKGNIKKLPLKYNFETSWWLWGWNETLYDRLGFNKEHPCYYSKDEIASAKKIPCIVHYVDLTTGRPWDYLNDNPHRKIFKKYYEMLQPWKKIDLPIRGIGAKSKIFLIAKAFIKKCMPFKFRSKIGFNQHDSFWRNKINEIY